MRNLALGFVGLLLLAMTPAAHAEDFSWTGPYIGLAIGGKTADAGWTTTSTSDEPGTIVDASSPASFNPASARIGGYAGYNYQIANWVLGLEADFAWADGTSTMSGVPGCATGCFPGSPGPGIDTASVKMGWDGSLRARAGYLLMPDLLLYGTGGVAWQSVEASGTCSHDVTDPLCFVVPGVLLDTETDSHVYTGWTVGAGLEKAMGPWLLRLEYRYAQFGSATGALNFATTPPFPGGDTVRYNLSLNTQIVTLGLSYKF